MLAIRMVLLGLFSLAGFFFFRSLSWPSLGGLAAGFGAATVIIYCEIRLQGRSGREILAGVLGLILGLIVTLLLTWVLLFIPAINDYGGKSYVIVAMVMILGYLGAVVGIRKRGDLRLSSRRQGDGAPPKVLDTSVIIDGRIADICQSHFIEGKLVIPKFVLDELQQIADSPDPLRRNRGRRGLEILRKMQLRKDLEVVIDEYDPVAVGEVDSKLVKFAQVRGAKIVTNDFNLNKIAELHGIKVLNVNELADALKPVVLPGEEISVRMMKRGKEPDQGVGYLNDGTMVVVEGGSQLLNKTVPVIITSVLQTTVGRMIFSRIK
ncbi:MAG: PIN domain-containing protein [Candidatus Eisenbacteria bacterium]